ncbi:MAG: PTS sugar transporter subunit IIC [Elusimicrobia bacterium]|nr:PTS sugar transporter subunit IIC [Elusimicrobiota bacterium]
MTGSLGLAVGAAAVAAAELDATLALQIMVSRAIVIGPLLGLAFGDLTTGVLVGLVVELLSHDKLPVGGQIPANATVSAGAGVLLAIGPQPLPVSLAVPAGLFLGWLHERLVDNPLRRRRGRMSRVVGAGIRRGAEVSLGGLVARELVIEFGATLALLLAALLALKPLGVQPWAAEARTVLGAGLWTALSLAPWFGAGMLAHSLRVKR